MKFKLSELARHRKYESGTQWCAWRWTDVEDNILRLHIVKTPWNAICLHWLRNADPEPYPHDHPVSFLSILLRGGYVEFRRGKNGMNDRYRSIAFYNWISTYDAHRITDVLPNTLTLCFMGPKVREWGFYTPKGWMYWRAYYQQKAQIQAKRV